MTFSLQFDEHHKLLALHRALMEAKFCEVPNDPAVSGSGLVAALANQVLDGLIHWNDNATGDPTWIEWRKISAQRVEWQTAVMRASSLNWQELDPATKVELSCNLLSPFSFDDATLAKFIEAAEAHCHRPERPNVG
jgi:hypothetical protein